MGLKQRELAALLKIGPQQLSDWERGSYRPNDSNLVRLSDELGRDFAWFFVDREPDEVAA